MAHYMWYSKKRVDAKEENSHRENIMKAWKDYTIEDAIIVIEKAVKVIKLEMLNACWQNCAWYCSWLHTIYCSQLINYERLVNVAKNNKAWGEEFQNVDLEEIKKLRDTLSEESTEDCLMELSTSKPMPKRKKT